MSSSHPRDLSNSSSNSADEKLSEPAHPEKLASKTYATVTSSQSSTEVEMSADRPASVMGPQGDHSSAYALFKHLVLARVESIPLEEAIKVILSIIDVYVPNGQVQPIFDSIKPELQRLGEDSFPWLKELKEKNVSETTINYINTILKGYKELYLGKMLSDLISLHLELRNQLASTSFPADGLSIKPPKDEGTRVKQAITNLKNLHYDVETGFHEKKKSISENEAIGKIVKSMLNLLWYPKVPDSDLAILNDEENWKNIVKRKNYRVNTKPRNNDETILSNVLFNHIVLIHDIFPYLSGREGLRKKINEEFLSKILSEQSDYDLSWKFPSEKSKEIKDRVLKDLEMRHDYTPGTSRKSSQSVSNTPDDEKKDLSSSDENQNADKSATLSVDEQNSDDEPDWMPDETDKTTAEHLVAASSIQTRTHSKKDEIDSTHLQSFNKGK